MVPSAPFTYASVTGTGTGLTPHSIRYASYPSEFDLVGRSPPQPLRGVVDRGESETQGRLSSLRSSFGNRASLEASFVILSLRGAARRPPAATLRLRPHFLHVSRYARSTPEVTRKVNVRSGVKDGSKSEARAERQATEIEWTWNRPSPPFVTRISFSFRRVLRAQGTALRVNTVSTKGGRTLATRFSRFFASSLRSLLTLFVTTVA